MVKAWAGLVSDCAVAAGRSAENMRGYTQSHVLANQLCEFRTGLRSQPCRAACRCCCCCYCCVMLLFYTRVTWSMFAVAFVFAGLLGAEGISEMLQLCSHPACEAITKAGRAKVTVLTERALEGRSAEFTAQRKFVTAGLRAVEAMYGDAGDPSVQIKRSDVSVPPPLPTKNHKSNGRLQSGERSQRVCPDSTAILYPFYLLRWLLQRC